MPAARQQHGLKLKTRLHPGRKTGTFSEETHVIELASAGTRGGVLADCGKLDPSTLVSPANLQTG
jgi:hypothetical protein